MKRISAIILSMLIFLLTSSIPLLAQDNNTAREEKEGKEIWQKLQAKKLACKNLTAGNFEALGEYFMGQMAGRSHAAMNNMMIQMTGEKAEEQMHVVMGKRLSGCDTSAALPQNLQNMMGGMMSMMMGMMTPLRQGFAGQEGGGNPMMGYGGWNSMMNGWSGFGLLGWLSILLFWGLLILGIIALIRYLMVSSKDKERSALEILKKRYAQGEISKKEFEEKKKDLL